MGAVASYLLGDRDEINDIILVPPLFERDHKGRSRLAKSSYDFLFIKPNLRWLFNDYLPVGAVKSILYFSPPEDPRISVTARFKASVDHGKNYLELGDSKYGKGEPKCHQGVLTHNMHDLQPPLSARGWDSARVHPVPFGSSGWRWCAGSANLRFQETPINPSNFFDVRVSTQVWRSFLVTASGTLVTDSVHANVLCSAHVTLRSFEGLHQCSMVVS